MPSNVSPLVYDLEVTYYVSGDVWARYVATCKAGLKILRLQRFVSHIEAEGRVDKRILERSVLFLIERELSSTLEGPVMLGERTDRRYVSEEEEQEIYQRGLDQVRLEKHQERAKERAATDDG